MDHVLSLLLEHERFVITTHVRLDGDALGSQLALGRFLQKLGKQVSMINNDAPPYNLSWLPGTDAVEVFDGSMNQRERIDAADVVIVSDTNALERLGRLAAPVQNSSALKVLIDHHPDPESWFTATYARDTASSTGELVHELISAHDPALIDTEIATALYTAIMTDTGSFRYSNVTPAVHRIIADLLERGDIEAAPIHIALFDTRSMAGLRLLGLALESITLCYGGQLGYMVVSQRMVRDAHSGLEETEGFVNYVLSIEDVEAAVIFLETDSGTKISFRSKGNVYVNDWARAFGGGGHRNASGAYVRRPLDVVVDEVIGAAPRFLELKAPRDAKYVAADEDLSAEDASYLSSLMNLKARMRDDARTG